MADIHFEQIIDQLTPTTQIETDFEGGLDSLASDRVEILLLSPIISGATGIVGQVYDLTSVQRAVDLFGTLSRGVAMLKRIFKIFPRAKVSGMPYAEGSGDATLTATFAVDATGAGKAAIFVAGRKAEIAIASGDVIADITAAMIAAVNAVPDRQWTATASTPGLVVLTADSAGAAGNSLRVRTEITPGIGTTLDQGGIGAPMASGTTDGDPTSQLAGITASRFDFIVLDTDDDTAAGAVEAHQESQSLPANQKWGTGIHASVANDSGVQTDAQNRDSYRMEVIHQEESVWPLWELAAMLAAVEAKKGIKFSVAGEKIDGLPPVVDSTKRIAENQIELNLEEGVTPIAIDSATGVSSIVRNVTTRQTVPIAFRDTRIIKISDFTDESIIAGFDKFKSALLKTESPSASPDTLTPELSTATLNGILLELDAQDYLQGVKKAIKAGSNFSQINSGNPDRIDHGFEFFPTRTAHQKAFRKTYVDRATS